MLRIMAAAALALSLPLTAAAQSTLLETATDGTSLILNIVGTTSIGNNVVAARFQLTQASQIQQVGAKMRNRNPSGDSVYFAIVRVTDASAFPAGTPFNDSEVLARVNTPVPGGDNNVLVPMPIVLAPGHYLLIVGTNRFGTSGGALLHYLPATPGAQVIQHNDTGWGNDSNGSDRPRLLVIGIAGIDTEILNAVNTRASQVSVDALQASVAGLAKSADLANLATRADVAGAQSAIQGTIGPANANLATQQNIADLSAALAPLDAAVSSRATQASVDAVLSAVSGRGEQGGAAAQLQLRIEIEEALADPKAPRVALFYQQHLPLVRQIVEETMAAAEAGSDLVKAQADFAKAEAAAAAGNNKLAYDLYGSAYRRLN